jgi:hypothetical protein
MVEQEFGYINVPLVFYVHLAATLVFLLFQSGLHLHAYHNIVYHSAYFNLLARLFICFYYRQIRYCLVVTGKEPFD